MVGLSFIFLSLRIYYRIGRRRQKLRLSDYFLIIGWINAVVLNTLLARSTSYAAIPMDQLSFEDLRSFLKILYVSEILCDGWGLYLPKFSLIAFYFDLIPRIFVNIRRALYLTTGFVISSSIVTICMDIFWCVPLSANL
jgi:hypothetical protein